MKGKDGRKKIVDIKSVKSKKTTGTHVCSRSLSAKWNYRKTKEAIEYNSREKLLLICFFPLPFPKTCFVKISGFQCYLEKAANQAMVASFILAHLQREVVLIRNTLKRIQGGDVPSLGHWQQQSVVHADRVGLSTQAQQLLFGRR